MTKKLSFFLLIFAAFTLVACSSGKTFGGSSKKCGCGAKQGMVGY
jgi:hypothetical protein